MSCAEHRRKHMQELHDTLNDAEQSKRLKNYFRAVEEDKTKEYHKKRGRA